MDAGAIRDDVATLAAAHERVRSRIVAACARAGRDPREVTLVAVSKTVPAERLRNAVAAGITRFGENRVQEAAEKRSLLPGASWSLVGPLQSNKARRAVATFDEIQTVDTVELALRLDRLSAELRPGRPLPVLLQVNVDADPAKAGFAPGGVEEGLPTLLGLTGLRLDGLMTVGRLVSRADAARETFRTLRELSGRLQLRYPRLGPALSMGMTDDFEVAIEEGATIVRVGRAIFGEREG